MQYNRRVFLSFLPATLTAGCWSPVPPGREGTFRFAVFGDGPYYFHETGRFQRVVDALNARQLAFVIHVGDIQWRRCSEENYRDRRQAIDRIRHPVIYTPGDNEWSDCVDAPAGRYDPLDRLESLRRVFFDPPGKSIGGSLMDLESQAMSPEFGEFREHTRWSYGGVMFMAVHVVGSSNGRRSFEGRTARHDEEIKRRMQAAVAWLYESFEKAVHQNAAAAVVAFHAGILDKTEAEREAYAPLIEALVDLATHFGRPVLVVHGDHHTYTIDRPFRDPVTGATVANLQRLQTFGSPDIGWVDVVVDTKSREPFRFEPNVTPRWMWW